MLRIYLDTNLLTKIANFPLLKEKLVAYADYLNIVYSSAHIDDLKRSTDEEKIQKDLNTIKFLSEDQCLAKYWGEDNLRYDTRDPIEFFDSFEGNNFDISNAFDSISKEYEKLGIDNPLNRLNGLNSISSEHKNKISDHSFLKRFNKEATFESLLQDVIEMLQNAQTSDDLIKIAKNNFDKYLPREVIGNVKGNIIDYLNEELPKTVYKKTFDELTLDSLKLRNKDKDYSKFDWFITRYNTLDLVGYKSDKKSIIPNIVTDAFHAYYAAHCDVFLSEDKRLKNKASVVYKEFGIKTLIFSEKEFCSLIDSLIIKIKNAEDIVDFIGKINTLNIVNTYSILEDRSLVREYYLGTFFAGYFDYIIWVSTVDGYNLINFIKDNNSFSNWYYFKELRCLVNLFFEWLGPDVNSFYGYNELEEYSDNKTWVGRKWVFENLIISFSQEKDWGIILKFETLLKQNTSS